MTSNNTSTSSTLGLSKLNLHAAAHDRASVVVKRAFKKAAKFARKQKWDDLRDLLVAVEEGCRHDLAEPDDSTGLTILHILCTYEPPLDVMQTVVRLFPHMASSKDLEHWRTPLHLAVEYDAPLYVLEFLLEFQPKCTEARDINGKTPLMVAVEEIGIAKNGRNVDEDEDEDQNDCDEERIEQLESAIIVLLEQSPQSALLVEDNNDRTALEHAVYVEAPMRTIKRLQRALRDAAREQRALELLSRREVKPYAHHAIQFNVSAQLNVSVH